MAAPSNIAVVDRPTLRFIPYWAQRCYRYQRFFVDMRSWEGDSWRSVGAITDESHAILDALAHTHPVEAALVSSLVAPLEPPVSRECFRDPVLFALSVERAVEAVQKWRRADFLYRLQGVKPYDFWEMDRKRFMARANVDTILYTAAARPSRPSPVRRAPQQGIIYLIHGEPLESAPLIGYVGQTANRDVRKGRHLSGGDPCSSFLVANIKALGFKPTFTVLQSCPKDLLLNRERAWYQRLTSTGWQLFNKEELVNR